MNPEATNYKALLKQGRLAKEVNVNDLLPFGSQDGRRTSDYAPTVIQYKDLVLQLVKDVHVATATVTGADNGLTLLGSNIELGGALYKNTEVDIASFGFVITNSLTGVSNGAGTRDIDGFYFADDTKGNDVIFIGYNAAQVHNAADPGALAPVALATMGAQTASVYGSDGVAGEHSRVQLTAGSAVMNLDSATSANTIAINIADIQIQFNNLTNYSNITMSNSAMAVRDNINTKGLTYFADYSTAGVADDRWIPDYGAVKAYADSVVGANNELSEILANGNTTSDGQTIDALNGGGCVDLRAGSDNTVTLTNDSGVTAKEGIYMSDDYFGLFVSNWVTYIEMATNHIKLIVNPGNTSLLELGFDKEIAILDNSTVNRTSSGVATMNAVFIGSNAATMNSGVVNSMILGAPGTTGKTSNTVYVNQVGFDDAGSEGILTNATLTSDKTWTLPNASGTVVVSIGTPTAKYLPKLDLEGSGLVDSQIWEDSGQVYIETPSTFLHVRHSVDKEITLDAGNQAIYFQPVAGYSGSLDGSSVTTGRTWTLPDATGTIALTTDIDTFANTDLTLTGARVHTTDGNALTISSDGATAAKSWLIWQETRQEIGFATTWDRYTATTIGSYVSNNLILTIDAGGIVMEDTVDFTFSTLTGTRIGTGATEKFGFYGNTPVARGAALTATNVTATDATIGTNDTITNNIRTRVDELEARLDAATGVGLFA
jgi:hypothetical protein